MGQNIPTENTQKVVQDSKETLKDAGSFVWDTEFWSPSITFASLNTDSTANCKQKYSDRDSFQVFFNQDFLNLPDIPRLNQCAEKLNTDTKNVLEPKDTDNRNGKFTKPYNSNPTKPTLTQWEETKGKIYVKEKEVPLYKDFRLPHLKTTKCLSTSMEFRTPNPKRPEGLFTKKFKFRNQQLHQVGPRPFPSCLKKFEHNYDADNKREDKQKAKHSVCFKGIFQQMEEQDKGGLIDDDFDDLDFTNLANFNLNRNGTLFLPINLLYFVSWKFQHKI